jgi:hypothetical protein
MMMFGQSKKMKWGVDFIAKKRHVGFYLKKISFQKQN